MAKTVHVKRLLYLNMGMEFIVLREPRSSILLILLEGTASLRCLPYGSLR